MRGKLYIVGTPIGNMSDITYRAVETLREVDVIACEDTRHSLPLLTRYGIRKQLVSYHTHNERESGARILSMLDEGKNVALITDAGMPCVSDPGAIVIAMAREQGYEYTVVPGASAVVSAVALCGIERRGFCFLGFLPEKKRDRDSLVNPYRDIDIQLVFYSSPHNINDDLDYLYRALGDRKCYAVKEITKLYERVESGILGDFHIDEPRGEYVLVVEGRDISSPLAVMTVEEHLRANIAKGMNKKDAIKMTARERGVPKDEVYKIAIELGL